MKQRREIINPGSECTVQEHSISLQQSADHEIKEIEDAVDLSVRQAAIGLNQLQAKVDVESIEANTVANVPTGAYTTSAPCNRAGVVSAIDAYPELITVVVTVRA